MPHVVIPHALLEEIRRQLRAGLTPAELAEELGRRALLDYSEVVSLRGITETERADMASEHGGRK